jgi:DNA (cytosine-5)-methyltransferase 1
MEEGTLDDAPLWSDLRTFDGKPWRGIVDCIIGGYPCQPFSYAGKKLGEHDPRHLWPDIYRIIRECEPTWCFFENVEGHVRLGYFDIVRPSLERLGYHVEEEIVEASEVGAPHRRRRLFILAGKQSAELANTRYTEFTKRTDTKTREHTIKQPPCTEPASRRKYVGGINLFPPRPDDKDAWRIILKRWPELSPATQPTVRELAHGLANLLDIALSNRTNALRLTGNGVVPLQAAYAWRLLRDRFPAD